MTTQHACWQAICKLISQRNTNGSELCEIFFHANRFYEVEKYLTQSLEEVFPIETVKLDHNWPDGLPDSNKDMFKIETVPMIGCAPKGKMTELGKECRETLAQMSVGQSFEIPFDSNAKKCSVSMAARGAAKAVGKNIITRSTGKTLRIYCVDK